MRVAPLGAFFAPRGYSHVADQARLSAEVTHFHAEGQAGAMAVAVAAAHACLFQGKLDQTNGNQLMEAALLHTPDTDTRAGIKKALELPLSYSIQTAVSALGNGSRLSAPDTVPYCLWCAARHADDFEKAMWATVSGLGDRDTTCAIVGGIVALSAGSRGIPRQWIDHREPLGPWQNQPE